MRSDQKTKELLNELVSFFGVGVCVRILLRHKNKLLKEASKVKTSQNSTKSLNKKLQNISLDSLKKALLRTP
jgi:hypothetical protein